MFNKNLLFIEHVLPNFQFSVSTPQFPVQAPYIVGVHSCTIPSIYPQLCGIFYTVIIHHDYWHNLLIFPALTSINKYKLYIKIIYILFCNLDIIFYFLPNVNFLIAIGFLSSIIGSIGLTLIGIIPYSVKCSFLFLVLLISIFITSNSFFKLILIE